MMDVSAAKKKKKKKKVDISAKHKIILYYFLVDYLNFLIISRIPVHIGHEKGLFFSEKLLLNVNACSHIA